MVARSCSISSSAVVMTSSFRVAGPSTSLNPQTKV
jgi:hypothetical protein